MRCRYTATRRRCTAGGKEGASQDPALGSPQQDSTGTSQEQPDTPQSREPAGNLFLSLVDSEDAEEDAHVLREAIRTLLEYSGTSSVSLEISSGKRRVRMDLPKITTGCCPELHKRLEWLLGEGSVRVEE